MQCASCGHENREGQRFCVECGTALALQCPSCEAPVDAGQKFCGECGTALGAPGPATAPSPSASAGAVRKTVTVLFADLGGSTGFGERTDAEITRQVLAQYHALLQEVIDAHAGTVAKFMGDGMMATFGIPEVAEDDARRAVDAGVALQQRFEAFAADIDRRHGETLTLRVGINTGEVVIAAGDADIIGDALNVAARLEKACRPGHVLVGEETWRLTRGDVAFESLGEVTVAGRAQPVAIYEVAATGGIEQVAAPFVGRDAEMHQLLGVLDDAVDGSAARFATVLGSPGVGKTRLSRELCARAAERADAQSVEIRCDRAGEATFAPIAQLVRESTGLGDDADADAVRSAIGTLLPETASDHARIVDGLAGLLGAAPARSVEETFWAVRRLVEATATDRPLVVVIDDIQWAEPLLLDLLEHLAEWVDGAAVLLLALARPELREVRATLAEPGRPVDAVVVLDGLDATATEALAAGLLGTERLPAGLVERLPESTDGNPLFVRELVRMLVDDQVIRRRSDGDWELTIDAEAVDVPPTIQSLLGARVERLSTVERELLEYASVIGAEFSLGALRELASAESPIASLLESMRRKELVEPTGTYWGDEPVHRFHHVLIHDAAYRRILKTTRAELHERVAIWTDRSATDLIGEHEAAIAYHYEQAYRYRLDLGSADERTDDLGRRAAELLSVAAQRALGRDDLAAAGALSAHALTLLPASDADARADLLTMGCECLLSSGDGAAARPLVEELGRVAGTDARLAAWAECFAAQLVGLTDPEGLVAADAQALAAAEALTELGDGSGQAKAHQVRAGLLARLGRVGDAELELDLALAAAREADDRRRVTAVLGAAPDAALFGPSPVARAGGRCLDVVRLLRITTASPSVEAASNRCQAVLESLRGRFDVSRSMLATARVSLEELGLRHGLAQTELYAGMVEMIAGDPHAAIAPLRAAYGDLGSLGVGADAGNAAALLARALLVEGAIDEADQMATASEQLAGQNLKTAIGWRVARAEVLSARGDDSAAVTLAEQAVEIAAGTDLVIDHADACVALATLRDRAGDAASARAARADAKRLYEQKGATVPAARLEVEQVPVTELAPRSLPLGREAVSLGEGSFLENTASRVDARIVALLGAGSDRELAELTAPEFLFDDRRHVVNFGVSDIDVSASHLSLTRREGFEVLTPKVIAVRGDRLVLSRRSQRTPVGDERPSYGVVEIDQQGRLLALIQFDDDRLDDAIAELDARYVAGEGAEHAERVLGVAAWISAFNAHDYDALRNLATPAFVMVDHRLLRHSNLDLDGFIESFSSYADVRMSQVCASLRVRNRVTLATTVNHAEDPEGGEIIWVNHVVGTTSSDGRNERIELFDEDDWDAALARFDELSTPDRRGPWLENPASRAYTRVMAVIASGDDRELGDLIAREFLYDDRRRVVNYGVSDLATAAAQTAWLRDEGFEMAVPRVLAVRGDRLALTWNDTRTANGDDISSLTLIEIDGADRLLVLTQFGEDDLDAAVEMLDAWYIAGEGAEHAVQVTVTARWMRALNAFDFDAMRDLASPDYVMIDHRLLGLPPVDIESFIQWQETYTDIRNSFIATRLLCRGRVALSTAVNQAVDSDGGQQQWVIHQLGVVSPDGRTDRVEIFADDDWDAALARFDELSAVDPRTPRVENAASRIWARVEAAMTGWEPTASRMIAVRGECLALTLSGSRTAGGDEGESLLLIESDSEGHLCATTSFDVADFVAAINELDEQFIAGEGAPHAAILRTGLAFSAAVEAKDFDAIAATIAPDNTFTDHRRFGMEAGTEGFGQALAEYEDVEQSAFVTKWMLAPNASLASLIRRGVDPQGTEVVWLLHVVSADDDEGRIRSSDLYDAEEWSTALARFDELSAVDPRTPTAMNLATRVHATLVAAIRDNDLETQRALTTRSFAQDDRRAVVAIPDQDRRGIARYHEIMLEQGYDILPPEPLAARGDRLTLGRVTHRTAAGDESILLAIIELDADGLVARATSFDEGDLAAAIDELDARHINSEGAPDALVLHAARNVLAFNRRDWDALRAAFDPATRIADHRAIGWPTIERDGFIDLMRGYVDLVPNLVLSTRKVFASGPAVLSVVDGFGETPDGGATEWAQHVVLRVSASGLIASMEMFAEEDWNAALARFDELAATPPADPRHARVENFCTRVVDQFFPLVLARRFDDAGELMREDFVRVDHRTGVSDATANGRETYMASLRATFEVGFTSVTVDHLAVRGDRLNLMRTSFFTDTGLELVILSVFQIDADGRGLHLSLYDPDDLVSAIIELDAQYRATGTVAAGEDDALRAMAAITRRDWEVVTSLVSPDVVAIDHRPLGFAPEDRDTLVHEQLQGLVAMVPDVVVLPVKVLAAQNAVLLVLHTSGTTSEGSRYEWTPTYVGHRDATGRFDRLEAFPPEQWDAALARFDDLAAESTDPRHPRAENAATRLAEAVMPLVAENRLDEAELYFADEYVCTDRRTGVAWPTAHGGREFLSFWRAFIDVGFNPVSNEYLAVRGERLHLVRCAFHTDDGSEVVFLQVAGLDESGKAIVGVDFDEDDLVAALEELDARYLAGDGAADPRTVAAVRNFHAFNVRDWDGYRETFAPEMRVVDHRSIGWPPLDRDEFLELLQGYVDVVPDMLLVPRQVLVAGSATLTIAVSYGTTDDGSKVEWMLYAVARIDDDCLISTFELFDETDWNAALARFDELAAVAPSASLPEPENAATRLDFAGRINARDADGLRSLMAPGYTASDRRSVTAGPTTSGEDFIAAALSAVDIFDELVVDRVVATRGDRLAVSHGRFASSSGFDVPMLILGEVDVDGRALATVMFDDDDLAGAMQELEDRYVAGERAADEYTIRRAGDFVRSMAQLDGAATLALLDSDVRFTDHRRLGFGSVGFDGVRGFLAARAEQIAEDTSYFRTIEVRGDTFIGLFSSHGVAAEGTEVEYEILWVAHLVAGKQRHIDWYDPEDHAAAHRRFEVLADADPRTPALDNQCSRVTERHSWLLGHDLPEGLEAALDLLAPDFVQTDRRRGPSNPDLVGRRERLQTLASFLEVFGTDTIDGESLAVRGDRLALHRWSITSGTGSEFAASGIDVTELTHDGRIGRITTFDDDDLRGAVEELERRHRELSGDAYSPTERLYVEGILALNRGDSDEWATTHAADWTLVDHSMLGTMGGDRGGVLDQLQVAADLGNFVLCPARIFVRGYAVLVLIPTWTKTADGSEYLWHYASVTRMNDAGLMAEDHFFQIEQWDEALALFDEWSSSEPADGSTAGLDNECVRVLDRQLRLLMDGRPDELAAGIDLFAPGVVQIDRRHGVAAPDLVGRDARVANLLAVSETFGDVEVEHIAVRGNRSSLQRWTITGATGFATSGYDLNELDADGRIGHITTFDETDLALAMYELDQRYFAGEGAEHASIVGAMAEFWHGYNARDWDDARTHIADDITFVDHEPIGAGTSVQTADQVIEFVRGLVDLVPDVIAFDPEYLVIGARRALIRHLAIGTTADGAEFEMETFAISEVSDGLATRHEVFAEDQLAEARARFEELEAADEPSGQAPT